MDEKLGLDVIQFHCFISVWHHSVFFVTFPMLRLPRLPLPPFQLISAKLHSIYGNRSWILVIAVDGDLVAVTSLMVLFKPSCNNCSSWSSRLFSLLFRYPLSVYMSRRNVDVTDQYIVITFCFSPAHNPCIPNPCYHNGTCINYQLSNYTCDCVQWYAGRNCENRKLHTPTDNKYILLNNIVFRETLLMLVFMWCSFIIDFQS